VISLSNADDKLIHYLPEDMGEGVKDFFSGVEEAKLETMKSRFAKLQESLIVNENPTEDDNELERLKSEVSKFVKEGR